MEGASWSIVGRAVGTPILRFFASTAPGWLLRRWWPDQRIRDAIEVFADAQSPRFFVRADRPAPEFLFLSFYFYNHSPVPLRLVGAEITVKLDATDLLHYEQRFPTEILAPPNVRAGFVFPRAVTDRQAARMREYVKEWANLQITGHVVVKSPFSEFRKELHAAVVAVIDR